MSMNIQFKVPVTHNHQAYKMAPLFKGKNQDLVPADGTVKGKNWLGNAWDKTKSTVQGIGSYSARALSYALKEGILTLIDTINSRTAIDPAQYNPNNRKDQQKLELYAAALAIELGMDRELKARGILFPLFSNRLKIDFNPPTLTLYAPPGSKDLVEQRIPLCKQKAKLTSNENLLQINVVEGDPPFGAPNFISVKHFQEFWNFLGEMGDKVSENLERLANEGETKGGDDE